MRNYKRLSGNIVFSLLLIGIIFFSGCWDAKELANLALVSAIGIDLDEKHPRHVLVTIQIIKPGEIKSASAGGDSSGGAEGKPSTSKKQPYLMVSSSGETVSEVFRNFVYQVNRELYFADNQIIVFGKEAARKGVLPYLDYFMRTREPRENVWILVAEGKAKEILETNFGLEKIPANEINQLIINRGMASQAGAATQEEFLSRLMSKASANYTSFIQVIGTTEKKKISLVGTAVFKGDKLVGEFDKKETRGLLWVINKVKRGNITVKSAGGIFNLDILRAGSKMVPEIQSEEVRIKITVNVEYGLTGETKSEDLTNLHFIETIEVLAGRTIRGEIKAALRKAFLFNTDVFGFGEAIHRKFPKEWKIMKPVWDQQFLATNVSIKINSRLRSIGFSVKPLIPK